MPFDRWERKVLEAFKHQLPSDWVVIPTVTWTLENNGRVRDGEADFVVLVPEEGLVVVEVKGSKEFKVGEDGIWRRKAQNDVWVDLELSPADQAKKNMYELVEAITENRQWQPFPGRYAYLVIYPQGKIVKAPEMFDESVIATYRNMAQLTSRIRNSLTKRGLNSSAQGFSKSVIEAIADQLKSRNFAVTKVDTNDDVENDLVRMEQLTRQQFASLKGLFQLPSVAVIGPAGSGKTILALWRLKTAVDQGLRPIYVCFNKPLAEFLRIKNPEYAAYIWNIDKLFLNFCPDRTIEAGNTEFYKASLPSYVMDREHEIAKYDAIIVDEGQDFSEEQIIALLELVTEGGNWAFFADWKQDLYSAGSGSPIGAEVIFHLHHNCRNTTEINKRANHYTEKGILSMPGMPNGEPPLVRASSTPHSLAWELAYQWSGEGTVAIISPFKFENSSMAVQTSGYGLRLSKDINELGRDGVVFFSTVKSFKGLEATSVIIIDIDIPDNHISFSLEDLYVACTRATTRLALIPRNKNAEIFYSK